MRLPRFGPLAAMTPASWPAMSRASPLSKDGSKPTRRPAAKTIAAHEHDAGPCGFAAGATDERVQHVAERPPTAHRTNSSHEPSGRRGVFGGNPLRAGFGRQLVADHANLLGHFLAEAAGKCIQSALKLLVEGQRWMLEIMRSAVHLSQAAKARQLQVAESFDAPRSRPYNGDVSSRAFRTSERPSLMGAIRLRRG